MLHCKKLCLKFPRKFSGFGYLGMSHLITVINHGYMGCNFCGHISCHNARKPSIIWVLCKNCRYINDLGGNPLKGLRRPPICPYTKPPVVNRSAPDCYSRHQTCEIFWWDTFDVMPEYRDCYHLLLCKPKEDRLHSIKIEVTSPTYITAYRLVHGIELESGDDDSDQSVD